jgi:hypothetical protein
MPASAGRSRASGTTAPGKNEAALRVRPQVRPGREAVARVRSGGREIETQLPLPLIALGR